MEAFSIAAKQLAGLNMPGADLRSFWFLLHLNFDYAWDKFPRIFNSFDALQKRMIRVHVDRHGAPPASFGSFADAEGYLKVGRLKYWHQGTNVTIFAAPDEVLVLPDGRLAVLDYKTARYSNGQDALLPLYEAQVSIYAYLLEALDKGNVAKAGLIYFEPCTGVEGDDALKLITKAGYRLDWETRPVPVEVDRKKVEKLLRLARKLYDMDTPPPCNDPKCEDCPNIEALYRLYRQVVLAEAAAAKQNQDGSMMRTIHRFKQRELHTALSAAALMPQTGHFGIRDLWGWPGPEAEDGD